jgi:hypothetical protein
MSGLAPAQADGSEKNSDRNRNNTSTGLGKAPADTFARKTHIGEIDEKTSDFFQK